MNPILDDSRYAYINTWWNPHFLDSEIDKDFRLQFNISALPSARIVFLILMCFWCGFVWFDQFLSPSSMSRVLELRFAIVLPIFLLLGAFSFSKAAPSVYQYMLFFAESFAFVIIIRVVVLYDDFEVYVNQLGFQLRIPLKMTT